MSGKRLLKGEVPMSGGGRTLGAGCGEVMKEECHSKTTFVTAKGVLDDGS